MPIVSMVCVLHNDFFIIVSVMFVKKVELAHQDHPVFIKLLLYHIKSVFANLGPIISGSKRQMVGISTKYGFACIGNY